MIQMILYQKYSREEVHTIFSPKEPFISRRGAWGVHSTVGVRDFPGDYIFFVTQQGIADVMEEGITSEGVFTWKSKACQSLADPQIRRFIAHDELKNCIYLFYRQKMEGRYTYLGRLKYLRHDRCREKPVYIQWQIMDWNLSRRDAARLDLVFQGGGKELNNDHLPPKSTLMETTPPKSLMCDGIPTEMFRHYKEVDRSVEEVHDHALNLAGEMIVIAHEKRSLIESGRADLAHKVRHVSAIEGEHAGYDILSYTHDGREKHIEVKTTRGPAESPFYMKPRELEFARYHQSTFYLYRVYEYDEILNAGKFYMIPGNIQDRFRLRPTMYRVGGIVLR